MRLILASQSPRRRQLLSEAGFDFEVILPSDKAESGAPPDASASDLVIRYAKQKAGDVAHRIDQGIIIGCDTVADCNGQVLGKPKDRNDAGRMLCTLRGREHFVRSGLCLWHRPSDQIRLDIETTRLFMKEIDDMELEAYLDSDLWVGKAGGFGYQDQPGWLRIEEGSESNVVGLPMELLESMLNANE